MKKLFFNKPGLPRRETLLAMTSWGWPGLPRRTLSVLLAMTVFCGGLIACGEKSDNQAVETKPVVKIGIVVPLTGEFAGVTGGFKAATMLVAEEFKKQNLKNEYVFLLEDDAFEAKRTLSAFNKLSSLDHINAVLSFGSQGGGIISPLAEKNKVVHINIAASEAKVADGKYNFIHWTLPSSTTKKLLDFYQKNGYKKITVVTPYNAGTLAIKEAFRKNIVNYPEMQAVYFDYQPNEKDFRLLMAKIKETNPDVVLTLAYGNNQIPFLKQYREAQLSFVLSNAESFAMLPDYSIAEGVYYTDVAMTKVDFAAKAEKALPGSSTFGLGNTYDALMLLVKVFEQAETPDKAVDELVKIKEYNGEIGLLTQDDNGVFNSAAVLKKVINGKPVVMEE